jgi:hypothetical protein
MGKRRRGGQEAADLERVHQAAINLGMNNRVSHSFYQSTGGIFILIKTHYIISLQSKSFRTKRMVGTISQYHFNETRFYIPNRRSHSAGVPKWIEARVSLPAAVLPLPLPHHGRGHNATARFSAASPLVSPPHDSFPESPLRDAALWPDSPRSGRVLLWRAAR